jgi:hypothetical protein
MIALCSENYKVVARPEGNAGLSLWRGVCQRAARRSAAAAGCRLVPRDMPRPPPPPAPLGPRPPPPRGGRPDHLQSLLGSNRRPGLQPEDDANRGSYYSYDESVVPPEPGERAEACWRRSSKALSLLGSLLLAAVIAYLLKDDLCRATSWCGDSGHRDQTSTSGVSLEED